LHSGYLVHLVTGLPNEYHFLSRPGRVQAAAPIPNPSLDGGFFMRSIVGGVLVLLLALPALRADDEPKDKAKDKPATPVEQYKALLKEAQKAQQGFMKALRDLNNPEEQGKLFREKNPNVALAPKFVAFAEKYPKEDAALDALIWVMTDNVGPPTITDAHAKAIQILIRDHIQNEKLGRVCQSFGQRFDKQSESFLRVVLEKNKNGAIQAEAGLALAQMVAQRAMIVKRLKDDPEMAKQLESALGKEQAEELNKTDLAKAEAESEQLFKELADKHIANMKPERLITLCQMLRYSGGKGGETLLHALLEKDTRPEVQGVACLTLAQMLKGRADETPDATSKEADKLREEAEKLFERAAEKFPDVKTGFRGTIGSVAKRELFDLRHLSVGKLVPDVEGEDQDGQKFKLSDYKGKVVLLDFWSEF
jgi:hypothetical protein